MAETAARSFSSFCFRMALYSMGCPPPAPVAAAAICGCFTSTGTTPPAPLTTPAPGPGLGFSTGLSSTASSRNFWKYHSEGHRFIAFPPPPLPAPATPAPPDAAAALPPSCCGAAADDGCGTQYVSEISSTENTRSIAESAARGIAAGGWEIRAVAERREAGGFEGLIGEISRELLLLLREEEEKERRGGAEEDLAEGGLVFCVLFGTHK
uniref:Uncharacterized protein n=1 Tax=Oryza brachyantha TaxID=4533 RepID=J3LTQ2_ORYBR